MFIRYIVIIQWLFMVNSFIENGKIETCKAIAAKSQYVYATDFTVRFILPSLCIFLLSAYAIVTYKNLVV